MYVLDAYEPKSIFESLHKSTVAELNTWFKSYKKPLLILGPVGIGKSTIVRLFANANNLTLYELTPSDDKDKETLLPILQAVSQSRSIFANKNLLFFDDIDVFVSDDKSAFDLIVKTAKESVNPVIFCATNLYADKKMSALRDMCEIIEMHSLHSATIINYLSIVLNEKRIKYDRDALEELVKLNGSDLRSTFLDIDYLAPIGITKNNLLLLSSRERKADVFKTIIGLFRAKTFNEAQKISDATEIDYDLLFAWVDENLHLFYEGDNLKEAYRYMSLADLNKSRIYSRQNWVFFKYFISLGIISPCLVPKKDKFTFKISFPQSIKMKTKESSDFSKNRKVANILGKLFRGSNQKISNEIFFIKFFLKDSRFIEYLQSNLTDEDLEYLGDFFKVKLLVKQKDDVEKEEKCGAKKKKEELKIEPHNKLELKSDKKYTQEERKESTEKKEEKVQPKEEGSKDFEFKESKSLQHVKSSSEKEAFSTQTTKEKSSEVKQRKLF